MPFSIGFSTRVPVITAVFAATSFSVMCLAEDKPPRIPENSFSSEAQTLGPGDQIQIKALHAEDLGDRPVRVDSEGFIMLPGLGRIRVGGLTTEQLSNNIRDRLAMTVRDPQVAIDLVEQHSQSVSVLGDVKNPGVYQIVGKKRVLDMLSLAGGLDPDAGDVVKITRAATPVAGASSSEEFDVTEIRVAQLMEGIRPETNQVVQAGDVITVPRAKLIYVLGEVKKAGGFVLKDTQNMSIIQALALAEGTQPNANTANTRILRRVEPQSPRKEIIVNLKTILAAKDVDQLLQPDDILYVPTSAMKAIGMRAIEAMVQAGTGVAIWRQY